MNKELLEIIKYFEQNQPESTKTVLATVVDVKGSSYRLPGARMLIGENGEMFGTVSGGCLEADVLERASRVLQNGEAEIFTYDTTEHKDSVFSLNMGCRGVIRILLEPINARAMLVRAWKAAFERQERQLMATLISGESSPNIPPGGRIFYSEAEQFDFENLPKIFESSKELIADCLTFFGENGKAQIKDYQTEQGKFEFFFEIVSPPTNLIVFGAGADAIPVAETAKNLGWRVCVVDHRTAFANKERFPSADEIILTRPENLNVNFAIDENTVAVVMSHNYEHDKETLRFLLNSKVRYIGALGPKRRTENILREWREAGETFSEEQLNKLYAPIGLDIGADTPESIALSIIAEIKSVLTNRKGGFLRRRKVSIYNR
ncbi:MAG TPA: XdhC/CoxI family protein [Pyrinomonadaceae bacterium]|nr:XdhC/CoxI family protein [Pyrinomonadaceae bacterium]